MSVIQKTLPTRPPTPATLANGSTEAPVSLSTAAGGRTPAAARTDEVAGDIFTPQGDADAGWGRHLVDVNVVMGDLRILLDKQATTCPYR